MVDSFFWRDPEEIMQQDAAADIMRDHEVLALGKYMMIDDTY